MKRFAIVAGPLLGCFAALALGAPALAAPEDPYFRRGVQAIDRHDYQLAEKELRSALQIDGQESRRKIAINGGRFEWYLPHYFLGLAQYLQGDIQGAYAAWSESHAQAVVHEWRDSARFEEAWASLQSRGLDRRRGEGSTPPHAPSPTSLPAEELKALLDESARALARAGPPNFRTVDRFVAVGEAIGLARHELGRRPQRTAQLSSSRDRLQRDLEGLARLPADIRTDGELADDLVKLVRQVRALGESSSALAEALDKLDIELRKNRPDSAVLRQHEGLLLRALHPQAFP